MKHFITCISLSLIFIHGNPVKAQSIRFTELDGIYEASYRGLSVINDTTAWVCGNGGMIGRTKDAGQNWEFMQIRGAEKLDFRSIHAFSYDHVVVANAGSPAAIYSSTNGGNKWTVSYKNDHPAAFLDGIRFFDFKRGLAVGDPIDGRLLLLSTTDGGASWYPVPLAPMVSSGEAVFAASGTSLRVLPDGTALIGTGGVQSRMFRSTDFGQSWQSIPVPHAGGKPTAGIFSVLLTTSGIIMAVGGDYENPESTSNNSWLTGNSGKKWLDILKPPGGYRSCIEEIAKDLWMTVGPTGAEFSTDKGRNWKPFVCPGANVLAASPNKELILMAGTNKIWRVRIERE